jgi:hypothetical protein
MEGWSIVGGKRAALVLPAVLLTVNLLETLATYKVRQHVHNVHTRSAITLLLYGAAFAIATDCVSPLLQRALTETRRDSRRHAGTMGLLLSMPPRTVAFTLPTYGSRRTDQRPLAARVEIAGFALARTSARWASSRAPRR